MKQILTNQDINTVIICTTPDTHKEIIIEMIKSNKNISVKNLSLKPLMKHMKLKKSC